MIWLARRLALAVLLRAGGSMMVAVAIAIVVGWIVAVERGVCLPRVWTRFLLVLGTALVSTFSCLGFSYTLRM